MWEEELSNIVIVRISRGYDASLIHFLPDVLGNQSLTELIRVKTVGRLD